MNSLSPITVNQEQIRAVFATKDLSEATIQQYVYGIKPFLAFLSHNKMGATTLLDFKRELAKRADISTATMNKHLAVAIVFMQQLNKIGKIPNWADNVKLFKESKLHKKPGLSPDEIRELIRYMSKLEPCVETSRFKALFCLKYYQGLRDIEIYRLSVADLNLEQATAMIQGKGENDKEMIYLFPNTVKALKNYLAQAKITGGAVFVSFSQNSYGKPLTCRSLYNIMAEALKTTGIAQKTVPTARRYGKSPHGFRKRFTTKLLDTFGDPRRVMKFTRHKSLATLMIYDDGRLHEEDVKKAIEAFSKV